MIDLPAAFSGPAAAPFLVLLRALGARVAPDSIDEIWLFPPHAASRAQTGIVVAAVRDTDSARRRVFTSHFVPEPVPPAPPPSAPAARRAAGPPPRPAPPILRETVAEHGSAPADRIVRLIDGVLRRLDEQVAQAQPWWDRIDGDPARWEALLAALSPESGVAA